MDSTASQPWQMAGYQKLAVCITFHYSEQRLKYLATVCETLTGIAPTVDLTIVTNATDPSSIGKIEALVDKNQIQLTFLVPTELGHPYFLTWSHLAVFKKKIADVSCTHFMYLEDDLKVTQANIRYWLEAREKLRATGLLPGFVRTELHDTDGHWYSTDVMQTMSLYDCPVITAGGTSFINIVYPYQGLYFFDRELMQEHLDSPSSNPDYEHENGGLLKAQAYGIREKASLGLSFIRVPKGFRSRNVIAYDPASRRVLQEAMVHHLPNNYANNPDHGIGKIRIDRLFAPKTVRAYLKKKVKTAVSYLLKKGFP